MAGINALMGKKIGMTRVFGEDGSSVPVTVLEIGPCVVLQRKTADKEGYNALQIGFGQKPLKRLNRPMRGHVEKAGVDSGFRYIKEIPVDDPNEFEPGQRLTLSDANISQLVDIVSVAKGRGFTGTVKRHGFSRGPMAHGSKHHRAVGSTGMSAYPSRVLKGKKMPGRMGGKRKTVKNSFIVDVRPEENLLLVKGGVAGAINQMVLVYFK